MNVDPAARAARQPRRAGHGWMMVICCIPMLAIAIALVALGIVNAGFLLWAVGCAAMMFIMMRMMTSGSGRGRETSGPDGL